MQTLIGQIEKIIYENDGFFIALLKSGDKVSASYFESSVDHLVGAVVTLKGSWEDHNRYGRSFKAHTLLINQNELFFFLNRVVKGFTKKLTADLIEHYSPEGLIEILENDIKRLLEIKGMNKRRLEKLASGWKQFRSMRELGEFLAPFGVTPSLLRLIAGAMREVNDPIEVIKRNPYQLMRINGIGFKKGDEIARNMGLSENDPRRIQAAMEYTLTEYCEADGNSCIEPDTLFDKLDQLLESEARDYYIEALTERIANRSIVRLQSGKLSPQRLYEAETFLQQQFTKRSKYTHPPIVEDLEHFLTERQLSLGEEQFNALKEINNGAGILLLVGYAGTGKSTTSKALLDLLALRYHKSLITTCALSGIASQRIQERSGYGGGTIQSLLIKHESSDFFPYKVVLIDEASMINSTLFARLMAKIDPEAIVIIVGDDAQLPPIGSGNPLSDAIALHLAPTVMLTRIYRQRDDQAIALIANDVRRGIIPDYNADYEDFVFEGINLPDRATLKRTLSPSEFEESIQTLNQHILARIAEVTLEHLPTSRGYLNAKELRNYLGAFQVISPMRGNLLGVDNLNTVLQGYFNPNPKKKINVRDGELRLMDKVVHTKNDNLLSYTPDEFKNGSDPCERRIFNGMCGIIFKINEEDELCFVYYPTEDVIVRYPYEGISEYLNLSYALSIHKVQGMEYDTVVCVISFSHMIMLNTKLLYTALTRAKKKCIVVGEKGAFEIACKRLEHTNRTTVMRELSKG